jgi:hypothetical protein
MFERLLALFFCLCTPKRAIKEFMPPLDSKEWKSTYLLNSTIGLGTFSFPFYFQGVVGLFASESMLASSISFLCLIREGVLSWALALLKPTSYLPIFFLLDFRGAC